MRRRWSCPEDANYKKRRHGTGAACDECSIGYRHRQDMYIEAELLSNGFTRETGSQVYLTMYIDDLYLSAGQTWNCKEVREEGEESTQAW